MSFKSKVTALLGAIVLGIVSVMIMNSAISVPVSSNQEELYETEYIISVVTELENPFKPAEIQPEILPENLPETENAIQPETQPQEGLLIPSELSAEELEKGLHAPLCNYASAFVQAEQESGVNAIFLSAVAAYESGWGKYAPGNNLFGWGYQNFSSPEECVLEVADKLKKLYLSPDGPYFNGYEVGDVNRKYNGRASWEGQVSLIMSQIENRIEQGS